MLFIKIVYVTISFVLFALLPTIANNPWRL